MYTCFMSHLLVLVLASREPVLVSVLVLLQWLHHWKDVNPVPSEMQISWTWLFSLLYDILYVLCFLLSMFLLYVTVLLPVGIVKDHDDDDWSTHHRECRLCLVAGNIVWSHMACEFPWQWGWLQYLVNCYSSSAYFTYCELLLLLVVRRSWKGSVLDRASAGFGGRRLHSWCLVLVLSQCSWVSTEPFPHYNIRAQSTLLDCSVGWTTQ